MTVKKVIVGAQKSNLQVNKVIIHSRFSAKYLYITKDSLAIPKMLLDLEIYSFFYDKVNYTYIIRI